MRILFCSANPVSQELGASRVLLGIANGLKRLGWECRIIDVLEMAAAVPMSNSTSKYADLLRAYLQLHAGDFDIVEYDIHHLPYPRSDFAVSTVFVARSVLLMDHLLRISPPRLSSLRRRVRGWLSGARRRARNQLEDWVQAAHVTVSNADLINVANTDDQRILQEARVASSDKICVIPYGLSEAELESLANVNVHPNGLGRVCFLGTFDERKGGRDLIKLFGGILDSSPDCKFRLIGTAGQYQSSEEVYGFFPKRVRAATEVIPRFKRADLPQLLEGCSLGVFPSYVEGFGFGVLEMMAAGVPVVAYEAPGPTMMLPKECLVKRGDIAQMEAWATAILHDEAKRLRLARSARQLAGTFTWDHACRLTDSIYRECVSASAGRSL